MKFSDVIAIGVFFYIVDVCKNGDEYKRCENDKMFHVVLLGHYIVTNFMLFGWMVDDPDVLFLYVTTVLVVLVHWFMNKSKCIITEYVKTKCKNKKYIHKDIIYYLGLKKTSYSKYIYILYYSFTVLYSIRKLNNKKI